MSNEQNPVQPLQPQVAQEPVAWISVDAMHRLLADKWATAEVSAYRGAGLRDVALYAAPAVAQEPPEQPNADAHLTAQERDDLQTALPGSVRG
jgi:hypothetical protein